VVGGGGVLVGHSGIGVGFGWGPNRGSLGGGKNCGTPSTTANIAQPSDQGNFRAESVFVGAMPK